jgi:transposase
VWADKPPEQQAAVYANRRRTRGDWGKKLQRLRSERSFAHVCESGGPRRTRLHGIDKVRKRYQIAMAAHNLGVLMRRLFGIGTPRGPQAAGDLAEALYLAILALVARLLRDSRRYIILVPTLVHNPAAA